ncbi:NUDIX domain-containing protein [Roseivivax sp. THAF40]|nr:NUDIX domain-containing protein [Roseivivax sp. THAF40]
MCSRKLGINMEDGFHGAKLVLTLGSKLVVLRRDARPDLLWPGMLDLPGGAREGVETPQECALREVREETGLALSADHITDTLVRRDVRGAAFFFRIALETGWERKLHKGPEGQGLMLMRPEVFIHSNEAIPHFRTVVRRMMTLPDA